MHNCFHKNTKHNCFQLIILEMFLKHQIIRMISEGSCDWSCDWSNDAENSALPSQESIAF